VTYPSRGVQVTDGELLRNTILIFGGLFFGAVLGMQASYLLACRLHDHREKHTV
jgi:membrane protein DedA with SNARE-associated domain